MNGHLTSSKVLNQGAHRGASSRVQRHGRRLSSCSLTSQWVVMAKNPFQRPLKGHRFLHRSALTRTTVGLSRHFMRSYYAVVVVVMRLWVRSSCFVAIWGAAPAVVADAPTVIPTPETSHSIVASGGAYVSLCINSLASGDPIKANLTYCTRNELANANKKQLMHI